MGMQPNAGDIMGGQPPYLVQRALENRQGAHWWPWWMGNVRNCPRCGYPVACGPAQYQQPVVTQPVVPQPRQPHATPVVGDVRTPPTTDPYNRPVYAAPYQYGRAYDPYASQ